MALICRRQHVALKHSFKIHWYVIDSGGWGGEQAVQCGHMWSPLDTFKYSWLYRSIVGVEGRIPVPYDIGWLATNFGCKTSFSGFTAEQWGNYAIICAKACLWGLLQGSAYNSMCLLSPHAFWCFSYERMNRTCCWGTNGTQCGPNVTVLGIITLRELHCLVLLQTCQQQGNSLAVYVTKVLCPLP